MGLSGGGGECAALAAINYYQDPVTVIILPAPLSDITPNG